MNTLSSGLAILSGIILAFASATGMGDEPRRPKPAPEKVQAWKASLMDAVAGADRLVIEPLFKTENKVNLEIKGAERLQELWKLVEIDDANSGFHCLCDGDHLFHVYKGDQRLATLGYHHGSGLRWRGGKWKGDALLTEKSQRAVPLWFKDNGYTALETARENLLRYQNEENEKLARFAHCFPEKARKYFGLGSKSVLDFDREDADLGRQIAKTVGDDAALTVAICRAFGTLRGYSASWTSTEGKERTALSAVKTLTGEKFLDGLKQLKDDRNGLRGAARLYFYEKLVDKLPRDVRPEWSVRLAEIVLTDDWDGNKSMTLRYPQRND